MYILLSFFLLAFYFLCGLVITSKVRTKFNPIIIGFFTSSLLMVIPNMIMFFKIITFETYFKISCVYYLLLALFIIANLTKIKLKDIKIKVNWFNVSFILIWCVILFSNTYFSVLSSNSFDDYHYIGDQIRLINNVDFVYNAKSHPANLVEGWMYFNAFLIKLLNLDPISLNRVTTSVVNITISVIGFNQAINLITNSNKKSFSIVLIILILFPIVGYEMWLGNFSRLIYRPYLGSSLSSSFCAVMFYSWIDKMEFKRNDFIKLLILTIFSVSYIHIITILYPFVFLLLKFIFKYVKSYKDLMYLIIVCLFLWISTYLLLPNLFKDNHLKSTFEFWNTVLNLIQWRFVLIYLVGSVLFIMTQVKKEYDYAAIVFMPILIVIIVATNIHFALFNIVYPYAVARFISQLQMLIVVYVCIKFIYIKDMQLAKINRFIIMVVGIIFFNTSSLYSGINQQLHAFKNNYAELKFTNLSKKEDLSSKISNLNLKKGNLLTQEWVNIDLKLANEGNNSYYWYMSKNYCQNNLYANLTLHTNKFGSVINSYDITNLKTVKKEIKKFKIKYVVMSEYYKDTPDFNCISNLNDVYDKQTMYFIKNYYQSKSSNKVKQNELLKRLIHKKIPIYKKISYNEYGNSFKQLYIIESKYIK